MNLKIEYTEKYCARCSKKVDVARLTILNYQLFATSTGALNYFKIQLPISEFLPEPSGCPSAP